MSEEEELESQKDFKDIMNEVKNVKVQTYQAKGPTLKCKMCKFNATSLESLEIHSRHIHEHRVIQCDQCVLKVQSGSHLKIHKKLYHSRQVPSIVIKKSLNLIKGEAGGLSDSVSNPKRGQVLKTCKFNVNKKRDNKSNQPGSNCQELKKESTKVDTHSGYNYQNNKKEYTQQIVIKKSLNLTKGEAGGLSEIKSNPKRGEVSNPCKLIINEKRDQLSNKNVSKVQFLKKDSTHVDIKPGSNYQEILKDSIQNMDNKLKGGDDAGDVAGEKKEGDEVGEKSMSFCNLCSTNVKDLKNHIENNHAVHGGGDKISSVLNESSEDDDYSIDSTNDKTEVSTNIYKENEWGNEDQISEPPIGKNMKSKNAMFAVAATKLKQVYRKNSVKVIGESTIHVTNVERKGTATEATIDIEDKNGKGKILLTYWGPNKKTKETTIQVNTTKGSDKRFVNTFSEKFLKPVIDRITNGVGLGIFF